MCPLPGRVPIEQSGLMADFRKCMRNRSPATSCCARNRRDGHVT